MYATYVNQWLNPPKNNSDLIKNKTTKRSALSYVISTNLLINAMECILNLSYKLPIKKWYARTVKKNDIVKKKKENVKNNLRKTLGILVDIPLHGYGNTRNITTSFLENNRNWRKFN